MPAPEPTEEEVTAAVQEILAEEPAGEPPVKAPETMQTVFNADIQEIKRIEQATRQSRRRRRKPRSVCWTVRSTRAWISPD